MNKALLASDLDNTLLFSYKSRRADDICVEWLDGKAQGYMTRETVRKLSEINQTMWFVPITSRSVAQYKRIEFPEGCAPHYALTTNGGILLVDGEVDEHWRELHLEMVQPWKEELWKLYAEVSRVPDLTSCRIVDELYLFAACVRAEEAAELALKFAEKTDLDVEASGRKVYFFPPPIQKGEAVRKLKEILKPRKTICAGDSLIDVPMLNLADTALVPYELCAVCGSALVCPQERRFPDFVVEMALQQK